MALKKAQKGQINESLIQPRREHKWSQEYVAEMIGTTPVSVSRWEHGLADPTPYFRKKLCELYGKSEEELGLVRKQKTKRTKEPAHSETRHEPVQSPHGLWKMPYTQSPFFTGRAALLQDIHDTLSATSQARVSTVVISGLGGIGKTLTAIEYAYRYRSSYSAVLWANAENYETLALDFEEMAGRSLLNLSEKNEQDQAVVLNAVKHWFSVHNNWLLILDNIENLAEIESFLPRAGHGCVLLTMRDQALGDIVDYKIHLEKMEPEEAATFLLRRTRKLPKGASLDTADDQDQRNANTLSEVLDYLPLALDQAGAYIEETQCSLSDYLDLYEKQHRVLLKRPGRLAIRYRETVATTWSIPFQKIERANPMSSDLLRFFAFLHADAIPEEIVLQCSNDLGPLIEQIDTQLIFNQAIEELLKYSLVQRHADNQTLRIHRLVQVVLKDAMDEEKQQMWAERTVRATSRVFPSDNTGPLVLCERYFPHAQVCTRLIAQWHLTGREAAHLLRNAGTYAMLRSQLSQALQLLQQALLLYEEEGEHDTTEMADCLKSVGIVYEMLGDAVQAETFHLKAQTVYDQTIEPDSLERIEALNSLILFYVKQYKLREAEPLLKRVWTVLEKRQESASEVLMQSTSIRARFSLANGQFAEAEEWFFRTLSLHEFLRGHDHPSQISILNGIVALYMHQGKFLEAEPLCQRILAVAEHDVVPHHHLVACHLANLGTIYQKQGKFTEAERLYHKAWHIREKVQGSEHPEIAIIFNNLGRLYSEQGNLDEAEHYYLKALTLQWLQ